MGISRYAFSSRRKQSGKSFIGTSRVNIKIRKAVMSGELNVTTQVKD